MDVSQYKDYVLADPNVIAVLQNLRVNVIWAIGESGVRGIKNKITNQPNKFRWFYRDDDPVKNWHKFAGRVDDNRQKQSKKSRNSLQKSLFELTR